MIAPRSIKVIQTCNATGRQRNAELCWRYICLIADRRTDGAKEPATVLDALLWGSSVRTERYAYELAL